MVRMRGAYYCNIKICMLYLVVYGHWIEPMIEENALLEAQYRWIYLMHMPVFAYLSGLFLKRAEDCVRQVRRLLPVYVLLQAAATLCGGAASPWTPWWHLWYLLSVCMWSGIAYVWFRFGKGRGGKTGLVICAVTGLMAGCVPWLDRVMSGARTAAFLPFFWAGLISDPDREPRRRRMAGLCVLIAATAATVLWGGYIPVEFLYHARPYDDENGVLLRLGCYILSGMMGYSVIALMPDRRYPFTRFGADTLPVYILHGPVVGLLRMFTADWRLCAVFSAVLIWGVDGIFRWNGRMFGIAAGEGRRKHGRFPEGIRTAREGGPSLSHGPHPG